MPDIVIAGATFNGVPSIVVPVSGGGSAKFTDVSDTTAAAADVASGKYFYTAAGEKTEGTGSGGGATLITKSITANGTYDAEDDNADGYSSVTVNVPGGGGIGTLLQTTALGAISTSSTTATDTGKTVSVTGINAYDLLIVETSVDNVINGRHTCTVALVWLTGSNKVEVKNTASINSAKMNMRIDSDGTTTTRQGTTAYGIYPSSATPGSNSLSMPMSMRYNSTSTGTIDGNYTTRVYGINLYDLIGG